MDDVAALPPRGAYIDDGVDRKVALTAFEPRGAVVDSTKTDSREQHAVHGCFQRLAPPVVEHVGDRLERAGRAGLPAESIVCRHASLHARTLLPRT